jgi:hypothetical protein
VITSTSFPSLLVILASYIFSTPPQPRIYLISILSTLTSSHDSLSAPAFSREFAVDFLEALDLFDITTPCPRVRLQQWTATCYLCEGITLWNIWIGPDYASCIPFGFPFDRRYRQELCV